VVPEAHPEGRVVRQVLVSKQQVLRFNDGSFIDFLTYETDLDKFGGPQRHFLGYDEPPPRDIRDEGLVPG
jgi:hypothetical protein